MLGQSSVRPTKTAIRRRECAGAKLGAKLPYAVDSAAGASARRIQYSASLSGTPVNKQVSAVWAVRVKFVALNIRWR